MNTYFQDSDKFNSNSRIYEGYFTESARSVGRTRKALDFLLSLLARLLTVLTCERAVRIEKASAVVLTLVGMVGLVGAMEAGSLGLLPGALIGFALLGAEVLILRRH